MPYFSQGWLDLFSPLQMEGTHLLLEWCELALGKGELCHIQGNSCGCSPSLFSLLGHRHASRWGPQNRSGSYTGVSQGSSSLCAGLWGRNFLFRLRSSQGLPIPLWLTVWPGKWDFPSPSLSAQEDSPCIHATKEMGLHGWERLLLTEQCGLYSLQAGKGLCGRELERVPCLILWKGLPILMFASSRLRHIQFPESSS